MKLKKQIHARLVLRTGTVSSSLKFKFKPLIKSQKHIVHTAEIKSYCFSVGEILMFVEVFFGEAGYLKKQIKKRDFYFFVMIFFISIATFPLDCIYPIVIILN